MYFNARVDDVMLIVKREMASVLRGPLLVTLFGCTMFISVMLPYRNYYTGISCPGKLFFGHRYFFHMLYSLVFLFWRDTIVTTGLLT